VSIVPVCKFTLIGPLHRREAAFEALQELGCAHLEGPAGAAEGGSEPPALLANALIAVRYLRGVKRPRRQAPVSDDFDFEAAVTRVMENRRRRRLLRERLDQLRHRVELLRPWGDFACEGPESLGGQQIWLYRLTFDQYRVLQRSERPWLEVYRDGQYCYVVVVAPEQPGSIEVPGLWVPHGPESLRELEAQIIAAEMDLDEADAERLALSRWIDQLERNLVDADNLASLRSAAESMYEADDRLFVISGWVPERDLPRLEVMARDQTLALRAEPANAADRPPTLLENRGIGRSGQSLLTFYTTPGYGTWDPSPILGIAFAVFFAMIVADAGYALTLWLLLVVFQRRLGATASGRDLRRLGHLICSVTLVYGVLAGSYWGHASMPGLPSGHHFPLIPRLDLNDHAMMIMISVVVGVAHVGLALSMAVLYAPNRSARVQSIGWLLAVIAGLAVWLHADRAGSSWWVLLGCGLILVVVGAGKASPTSVRGVLLRLGEGLLALRNVTQLFGDVMSYLRLFALGLASGSLAVTFNGLAAQVHQSVAGVGLLLALLVLVIGHGINLLLAVIGGTVHGLRLNYIEFLHWGSADEGRPFRPFHIREL